MKTNVNPNVRFNDRHESDWLRACKEAELEERVEARRKERFVFNGNNPYNENGKRIRDYWQGGYDTEPF